MTTEQFERETRYQTMIAISRTMVNKGILSQDDFEKVEGFLREKYQPIFHVA